MCSRTAIHRPCRRAFVQAAAGLSVYLLLWRCGQAWSAGADAHVAFADADFETLFAHAQRYGSTSEIRERRRPAREELMRRGAESLDGLLSLGAIENPWVFIFAEQLVLRLEAGIAVPVLLRHLNTQDEKTLRMALFLLGFYDVPEHADAVFPFLERDECAGAAIRTLGKWRVRAAVDRILPFLDDERERRRIVAVNALRDIGDGRAVPHLVRKLDDPVFTVRKTASRALTSLARYAGPYAVRVWPDLTRRARRELIPVLATADTRAARRLFREQLRAADPFVRADAERVLDTLRPGRSRRR